MVNKELLDSALARPRSEYYESLSEQAAALMYSLCLNHCFVDGNKRMAFAMATAFLKMNGYNVIVKSNDAENFIVKKIIQEKADIAEISQWLEKYIVAR